MKNINLNISKLKNYQIPNNVVKNKISEIKNQINAKFNFLKNPQYNFIKINKNISTQNRSSNKYEKSQINNKQKNISLHKSYLINKKSIPILLKNVINSTKNNSIKLSKTSSLNFIETIHKEKKNKNRPLSSCINSDKNYSLNKHKIYKLINNNKNFDINKSINFHTYKESKINLFNKSVSNRNGNDIDKEFNTSLSNSNNYNTKIKYKLKIKNNSQIIENEKGKYNNLLIKQNLTKNVTPSFDKLKTIKNHSLFPNSNVARFSKVKNDKLKYYSLDAQNKNNSNYIRQYFFLKMVNRKVWIIY